MMINGMIRNKGKWVIMNEGSLTLKEKIESKMDADKALFKKCFPKYNVKEEVKKNFKQNYVFEDML